MYPALAVLQALDKNNDEILWVGGEGGMENELVSRANLPFKAIPAAGVHGLGLKAIAGVFKLTRGYFAARKLIADFKPDVLFFTGGYVAIPVALAGLQVPTVICLPDIEPGRALQVVTRFADRIAVPGEDSRQFFKANKQDAIRVTGYPTRPELSTWEREAAFSAFDLDPDKPTLLITGGSKGARSINRAVIAGLPELLPHMQIIHISGTFTWPEVEAAQAALQADQRANYRAFPYLHENMGAAYTAADLVVCRGGASTLGELPLFGLPGIIVPYPHAWRYQKVNAEYLASRGGAIVLPDEDLPVKLTATILDLMHNKSKRAALQAAMRALAVPEAPGQIAALIRELGEGSIA